MKHLFFFILGLFILLNSCTPCRNGVEFSVSQQDMNISKAQNESKVIPLSLGCNTEDYLLQVYIIKDNLYFTGFNFQFDNHATFVANPNSTGIVNLTILPDNTIPAGNYLFRIQAAPRSEMHNRPGLFTRDVNGDTLNCKSIDINVTVTSSTGSQTDDCNCPLTGNFLNPADGLVNPENYRTSPWPANNPTGLLIKRADPGQPGTYIDYGVVQINQYDPNKCRYFYSPHLKYFMVETYVPNNAGYIDYRLDYYDITQPTISLIRNYYLGPINCTSEPWSNNVVYWGFSPDESDKTILLYGVLYNDSRPDGVFHVYAKNLDNEVIIYDRDLNKEGTYGCFSPCNNYLGIFNGRENSSGSIEDLNLYKVHSTSNYPNPEYPSLFYISTEEFSADSSLYVNEEKEIMLKRFDHEWHFQREEDTGLNNCN